MASSYFAPNQLSVTPTSMRRVELLGGCFFDRWVEVISRVSPGVQTMCHPLLRTSSTSDGVASDLRLVQVPLRFLYTERITMQPPSRGNKRQYETLFEQSVLLLRQQIERIGGADPDRPTFFLNYPLPQRSAIGRLQPRYDLGNPTYYIQRLNRQLADMVADYAGGYVLDIEQIAATFGRRFVQDDAFCIYGHGGLIDDADHFADGERLEPEAPLSSRYRFEVDPFIEEVWRDAIAMLRTIRGTDRVKMVCVDLDDTLWRGVLAEADQIDPGMVEGWPMGFAEALMILKQRGIILSIVSKNDEARAEAILNQLYDGRITLSDFPIRMINWRPKADNVADAIAAANVLPDSVLFIDDNPAERAAVKQALPAVRTLGAPHLDWRRILLWSSETQVPAISSEAVDRNDMIGAQVARERSRSANSREQFLEQLKSNVVLRCVKSRSDGSFERAFELINKTNQFNTTGRRWSHAGADAYLESGGCWWVFTVRDEYTSYGLVGLLAIKDRHVDQFVMSCRVFGLEIEQAVLAALSMLEDAPMTASLIENPRNGPSRDVYAAAGWILADDLWVAASSKEVPPHIQISLER